MSTSITNDQLALNVAATLLSMQKPGVVPKYIQYMNKAAAAVLNALDPQWAVKTGDAQLTSIYEAILNANIASFKRAYPDAHQEYNLQVPPLTAELIEKTGKGYPFVHESGVQGLAFLSTALDSIMHGQDDRAVSQELSSALNALDNAVIRSLTLHARVYESRRMELPSVQDVVESMTRLYAHGDYLYNMQAGASNTFRILPELSTDPDRNWGNDIFVAMYQQGVTGASSISLPINKGEMYPRNLVGMYKNSSYRVTGDIPYPTQADADLVNSAAEFLRNRLAFIHLSDAAGVPLDDQTRKRVISVYNHFANTQQRSAQHLRLSETWRLTNLPYSEASAQLAQQKLPTQQCLLVHNGPLPSVDPNHHYRKDISERVSALANIVSNSAGRVSVLTTDAQITPKDVQAVFPHNIQATSYALSSQDIDQLRYANIHTQTPVEMVISQTLFGVYDAYRINPSVKPTNVADIQSSFAEQLNLRLNGVTPHIMELLQSKITSQSLEHGAPYIASDMRFGLNKSLKDTLSISALNVPEPSIPEIKADSPRMTRTR